MAYLNVKNFLRFLNKSFFHNRGTNYRLTIKRLGILLLALGIYLPAELLIWSGLLLDEAFFSSFRRIRITQPVFIIGNPRSGTTYLHRVLAGDSENFLAMQAWEIFCAPSVLARKIIRFAANVAQTIGMDISRRIRKMEELWEDNNPIHHLKVLAPEEDEYLFIHIFSTLKIWSYLAMEDEADPFIHFDEMMPDSEKYRMMEFYESCIKRHIFYHGNQRRYLSKNPHFSPSIGTLLDRFPDSKFIYLIRDPLEAIPSHINLKNKEWQMLGSPLEEYACRDFVLRSSVQWYDYPLERLAQLPDDQQIVVRFDDLVSDTKRTVQKVYQRLGLVLSQEFLDLLEHESKMARKYRSQHHYSLEEMGISSQVLEDRFAGIINKYQLGK